MKQIDIEDDLYKYILLNIEDFGETPSQILRRLLKLPEDKLDMESVALESHLSTPSVEEKFEPQIEIKVAPTEAVIEKLEESIELEVGDIHPFENSSLPKMFTQGLIALFANQVFQKEPIITNKFKMMLTTMYYEDKEAFIRASKVAKGRFRDYLGVNLDQLLASPNTEEVALLIASKPRDIPYTPFWVVTNANTGRKRIILTQVMASMGYPHHLIERIKEEI